MTDRCSNTLEGCVWFSARIFSPSVKVDFGITWVVSLNAIESNLCEVILCKQIVIRNLLCCC